MNKSEYQENLGLIKNVFLGREGHDIFTMTIDLDYDNGLSQSVGFYALDTPLKIDGKFVKRIGTAEGMQFIINVIDTVGVNAYHELNGKYVWVLFDKDDVSIGWGSPSRPVGLRGFKKRETFIFQDIFNEELNVND